MLFDGIINGFEMMIIMAGFLTLAYAIGLFEEEGA